MTLAPVSIPGSGRRKAAVALVALGAERAATLLHKMDEEEVRALAAEVAVLGPVSPEEVRAALSDLNGSISSAGTLPAPGTKFARELLVRALGEDRGHAMASELELPPPFAWLAEADPDLAARALTTESPSAVALALVHLPSQAAARLLTRLPEAMSRHVATRIATLQSVHPETVSEVDAALRARLSSGLVNEVTPVAGTDLLAGILSFASRDAERGMIQALAAVSPELADAVKSALFTFDDIAGLEPRALQTLLKAVDTRELAMALKNAKEHTLTTVLANLSERARETLLEEIDLLTTIRPAEIQQARQSIVATCRRLEEEGTITIARPDDDE